MTVLDPATLERLERFRVDVATLPNEAAKTHRFIGLVADLFPGSDAVTRLTRGIEKTVRIGAQRRRIDSYFGNALIEFEKSLDASLKTAEAQLREQAAGLWNGEEDPERGLLAIASDGIRWETYQARLDPGSDRPIQPEHVHLESLQSLRLTPESLSGFWLWLTGLLFRDAQTLPTAERFQFDFGALSPAFLDGIQRLRRAWSVVGSGGEARVAFEAWRRYLTVTYGQLADSGQEEASPETVELFLKHTYLALLARLLVWAALSKGRAEKGLGRAIDEALSGTYFQHHGIENLVESDFFQWALEPRTADVVHLAWERALSLILTYDLSRLNHDVLKGVYQQLVDPKDRHDLGEYYTPEWLCARIVQEMMPASGTVSVLDPTCGSGSFLRAAIAHLIDHNPEMDQAELLAAVLDNVVGIDIHPLAVIIARATYVLALRDLVAMAKRPIHVPVYLADALFLPNEIRQSLINGTETEVRFGLAKDRKFFLPTRVLQAPGQFDAAIALATRVAEEHAKDQKESPASLRRSLTRNMPDLTDESQLEELAEQLWEFAAALAELINSRANSIWSFIIRNGYRPALLKKRFGLILGNPPWLSYRYISDLDYQAEVKKRAVDDYGIAPRAQKLFTQMELATVFLFHSLSTYGKEGARLAFVMPRSVLTADQHEALRSRNYKPNVALTGYWDLFHVQPLFNVPTCVLFARNIAASESRKPGEPLPAVVWSGNLPSRNLDWPFASSRLTSRECLARVVHLGDRTAFSTADTPASAGLQSAYLKRFHQGTTIVPRNFYFIKIVQPPARFNPNAIYGIDTDPEQARDGKPPYKDIFLGGLIEGQFLFRTAISKNVLPFIVLDPAWIVLPIVIENGKIKVWTARELKDDGWRRIGDWMGQAEHHWNRHRGLKAERQSVYQRLDYQRGLSSQDPTVKHLVLYNASGTNLSAAVFSRKDVEQPFIVDHKLYYFGTNRLTEADYLACILNSEVVNEAIKPFQSTGLQGERDIHKKVLELPIPLYDGKNPEHRALAQLGAAARHKAGAAAQAAQGEGWSSSLARRRAVLRTALLDELALIDDHVRRLLHSAAG